MEFPRLIESNVKNFMHRTLNICHEKKIRLYSTILNIIILVSFLSIAALMFLFCYKTRKTPFEKYQNDIKVHDYIMSKIRNYQNDNFPMLTNIPQI
jgi:hypothetical protein